MVFPIYPGADSERPDDRLQLYAREEAADFMSPRGTRTVDPQAVDCHETIRNVPTLSKQVG